MSGISEGIHFEILQNGINICFIERILILKVPLQPRIQCRMYYELETGTLGTERRENCTHVVIAVEVRCRTKVDSVFSC